MAKVNHYTKSKYCAHLMTWRLFFCCFIRFSCVSTSHSFSSSCRAKTCLKYSQNGSKRVCECFIRQLSFLCLGPYKFWWNRAHCDSNNQQFHVMYWIRDWLLCILFERSTRNAVHFVFTFLSHFAFNMKICVWVCVLLSTFHIISVEHTHQME